LIRENTSPSFFKHRFATLEKIHLSLKGEARVPIQIKLKNFLSKEYYRFQVISFLSAISQIES